MGKFKNMSFEELKIKAPLLLFFINILQNGEVDINKFLIIYEIFIRKIKKKKIDEAQIKHKIYNPLHQVYLSNLTPTKYINWMFSP